MRVLSVDDKAANRDLVEAILRGNGHEVESAINGACALALLQTVAFDLIISDILMPVMDGYKLCQMVKADERLRHIPFIVYTSTYTSREDEAFARTIGADRFIQKPCAINVFMDIVREVTAKPGDGKIAVANQPPPGEEVLQLYNERLVHKLEKKTEELEKEIGTRLQAQKSQKDLEAQLHQAQKMESIGRLAGGVAHDYNNMLSVILGNAQMAIDRTEPGSLMHGDLQEIISAAQRSAVITRQLLAFARKQIIEPQIIDLNETVEGMLNMLRRLIGEDINLIWRPTANLWPVKTDPSQVDQILANLSVNARDAIEGVGRITIETAMVTFDTEYCSRHAEAVPGEHVLLAVSDDGCGIDQEVLDKIFEPFFTTKKVGKGTGLGLATVYGIVKQNNGFIDVASEPGHRTTFKIYLPRCLENPDKRERRDSETIRRGRGETVLVVENEMAILKLIAKMLKDLGYSVLAAGSPEAAVLMAREQPDGIDLLLANLVMPDMSGRNLAKVLLAMCPNLKCLFMSGYAACVIASRGVLGEGMHFIGKPFTVGELAAKVREALAA